MSRFTRVLALTVVATAMVVQMAVPSGADDQAPFDFATITLDAPAAQAESDRANLVHAQYVAGQNPSDPNNITCSVFTPVAQGTPLIVQGPIAATHEDVATGEHDCIDRQRGSFRHVVQISFEYRKNGVWLPTDVGTQTCSHNAVQGVSIFHVDCLANAEYPLVPNHPSLGFPHRARYDVLEPKVMPPVYSGMFLTLGPGNDAEAIYEANRGHHCQVVWGRDRQETSAGPSRDLFCLDAATCADFLFLDDVFPCERRITAFSRRSSAH